MSSGSANSVGIAACGLRFVFRCDSPAFVGLIATRHAGFLESVEQPDLVVTIDTLHKTRNVLRTSPNIDIARTAHGLTFSRNDFSARFTLPFGEPAGRVAGVEMVRRLPAAGRVVTAHPTSQCSGRLGTARLSCVLNRFAFDTFLRSTLQVFLAGRGRLLVHAAAIRCRVGREFVGYLVPGRSGMGKSTLAAKFGREDVLSDELPCLGVPTPPRHVRTGGARQGDRPRRRSISASVFGTPFHGRFSHIGRNVVHPLAGIFFLERHFGPRAVPLGRAEAVLRLMGLVACYEKNEAASEVMLATAYRAVSSVPSFIFGFDKDEPVESIAKRMASAVRGRRRP
ncbi:MAG: hypothetical protein RDV41_15785 [Planctomycetota bacterium]|nr:hypothetical protein [Planctomycetota bacterium]